MPAVVCRGDIERMLPPGLTSVDISSLRPNTDLVDKYVHATVHHRYQHYVRPVPALKLILKNSDGSVISLMALGQVADNLDVCVQGDTLICLKFIIEACPGHYSTPYQIIADDTLDIGCLVWIFKKINEDKTTQQIDTTTPLTRVSSAKIFKKNDDSKRDQQTDTAIPLTLANSDKIFKKNDDSKRDQQTDTAIPLTLANSDKPCQIRSYTYIALSELKESAIANVYGVVNFYRPPIKTKGPDYCCIIGLTDPSLDSPDGRFSCNIFRPNAADLPFLEVGNVVRFHRLKVQGYQGKKQGNSSPGFQWLVFRGSVTNRETSSPSYTFNQQDEDKVQSLLKWWQENKNAFSAVSGRKQLCAVQAKDYFDLICQVIRICDLGTNCKLCRVWDGTKFEGPLKMSKEEEFRNGIQEDGRLMEASVHLAVDVYLFDNHVSSANKIKPGDFIQLNNLHAALVSDQVELTLHGGTWFNRGVVVLSNNFHHVRQIQDALDEIINQKTNKLLVKEVNVAEDVHRKANENFNNINSSECSKIATTARKSCAEKQNVLINPSVDINSTTLGQCNSSSVSENIKVLKQLTTVSEREQCQHNDGISQRLHQDTEHLKTSASHHSGQDTTIGSNLHTSFDPLELSTQSVQSFWLSAYEDSDLQCQVQKDAVTVVDPCHVQDSNISSSGTSDQCLQSTSADKIDTDSDFFFQTNSLELNTTINQTLQTSQNILVSSFVNPHLSENTSTQRILLSLKRKIEDEVEDNRQSLTVSKYDVLSLNSSILCFDSVGFTEINPPANVLEVEDYVKETELDTAPDPFLQHITCQQSLYGHGHTEMVASRLSSTLSENICMQVDNNYITNHRKKGTACEDAETPLRCMLRTASTVINRPLVSRSSLKEVLEHTVPHKFIVLVRVQDFKPNPVSAAKLIKFICSQCHHMESAESLQVPLDTQFTEHVCPKSMTQPVNLEPTIIMTFVLTDGEHSLIAYLWEKQAVQFFRGIEPLQLLSSPESFDQVQSCIESLCPENSTICNRPLLECCLFSYGSEGSVKYQIFDTQLV